jgi:hypothetical protein
VIVYGYSMHNMRMDPAMKGRERTVRRINTTEEGTTTLPWGGGGGGNNNPSIAVGNQTPAYS